MPLSRSVPQPSSAHSELISMDSLKVPSVFTAARNALYTRYTPNDWLQTNNKHYQQSDQARSLAEKLRQDCMLSVREADDRTKRNQEESGKRLGERVGSIEYWRYELGHETDNMISEINALNDSKNQLEKALMDTEQPLKITQECLFTREKRQGVDLVHDDVERELIREVDIIKQCQDDMRRLIEKANVQLSLNRAAQHELEKDVQDKYSAKNLDEHCHNLHNAATGIAFHVGVENIDNTVSVPESWAKFSADNIARSQAERAASKQLRADIDALLARTTQAMWQQWNAVNVGFTQRIAEETEARNKIETHLGKVAQEIFDMQSNVEMLKQAIKDKEAPLMVAQTRLDTRIRRPNVELCRDPAQLKLVNEVNEIYATVDHLQARLREAEAAFQNLLYTKHELESQLALKNNTLFLDREKCMGLRKAFPLTPRF